MLRYNALLREAFVKELERLLPGLNHRTTPESTKQIANERRYVVHSIRYDMAAPRFWLVSYMFASPSIQRPSSRAPSATAVILFVA